MYMVLYVNLCYNELTHATCCVIISFVSGNHESQRAKYRCFCDFGKRVWQNYIDKK